MACQIPLRSGLPSGVRDAANWADAGGPNAHRSRAKVANKATGEILRNIGQFRPTRHRHRRARARPATVPSNKSIHVGVRLRSGVSIGRSIANFAQSHTAHCLGARPEQPLRNGKQSLLLREHWQEAAKTLLGAYAGSAPVRIGSTERHRSIAESAVSRCSFYYGEPQVSHACAHCDARSRLTSPRSPAHLAGLRRVSGYRGLRPPRHECQPVALVYLRDSALGWCSPSEFDRLPWIAQGGTAAYGGTFMRWELQLLRLSHCPRSV